MIRGLLEKELRQHGTSLFFLLGLLVSGVFILGANQRLAAFAGTPLESLRLVVTLLSPLACFFLSQILIAGEFRNRTQLFLEGLPLPRWWMMAVKYALGLFVVMLAVALALTAALAKSARTDALTWEFTGIIASRAFAWTLLAYSVFFALAFLGRYRIAVGVLVVLGLVEFAELGVPVSRFCAFQLIDSRFAYERVIFPGTDVFQTVAIAVALTGLGFWLGLMRDSTVASLLAERMSAREKVVLSFLCIAAAMGLTYVSGQRRNGAPVSLPGAYEVDRGPVHVAAAPAVDAPSTAENAAAKRIATQVADELAAVAAYLGCSTMPPVFVIHRRDFAAGRFENGGLKMAQGLMVRVNLTTTGFDEALLRRWIVREALLVKSNGRANLEKNAWVLDGFPLWWMETLGTPPAIAAQPAHLAEARAAMPASFTADSLRAWFGVRQAAGEDKSRALAWSGLSTLAARHGAEACRRFLSSMLAHDSSADARGWLGNLLNPMATRFHATTGLDLAAFVAEWQAAVKTKPAGGESTASHP